MGIICFGLQRSPRRKVRASSKWSGCVVMIQNKRYKRQGSKNERQPNLPRALGAASLCFDAGLPVTLA